ncbi:MAG: putative toxin-antitoxin system toxin component, PIN family [Acidobacteria bacterium]|nr:putative toxin-antitoxin system toxin component, PIN family [Acidobacteriota bacterium]
MARPCAAADAVCRDPDDDWVLATALAGNTEAIVTGDADLLTIGSYSGIEIISPRQFVSRQTKPGRR